MRVDTIALCYPNRVDVATLSSPTPFVAGLPLTNLQDRVMAHPARRLGTAALQISGTFALPYILGSLAIAAHNLTMQAMWRVRLYKVAGSVGTSNDVLYDSGQMRVWPSSQTFGSIPWGFDNWWTGTARPEDLASFTALAYAITDPVIARGFTIDITDSANPDGWLQIGRLFVADVWQPTYNFSFGCDLNFEDKTEIEEARSGTEYFDVRRLKRLFDFTLEGMSEADALGRATDLKRLCGTSGELLLVTHQEGGPYQAQQAFVGRLKQLDPLRTVNFDWRENAFSLKEII